MTTTNLYHSPHTIFYTLIWLFLFAACQETTHHHNANKHMNESDFEALVERFENRDREQWQQPNKVIAILGDINDKIVADIGAGTGYFAFRLLEKGAKVIAIDIDERFAEYMEKRKQRLSKGWRERLSIRIADEDDPHLKINEADIVLIVNTYHHIQNRVNYFRDLQKNININGQLFIVDFKKGRMPVGPPNGLKIAASTVQEELQEAGYHTVTIDNETLKYQYIIKAF